MLYKSFPLFRGNFPVMPSQYVFSTICFPDPIQKTVEKGLTSIQLVVEGEGLRLPACLPLCIIVRGREGWGLRMYCVAPLSHIRLSRK